MFTSLLSFFLPLKNIRFTITVDHLSPLVIPQRTVIWIYLSVEIALSGQQLCSGYNI